MTGWIPHNECAHVLRVRPPWRDGPAWTLCGYREDSDDVEVVAADAVHILRSGAPGTFPVAVVRGTDRRVCAVCAYRGTRQVTWDTSPSALAKHTSTARLDAELRALAALVAAHPQEFRDLLDAELVLHALRPR